MPMTSTTAKAPVSAKATAPSPAPMKAATPAPSPARPKTYTLRIPATSIVTAIQYLGKPDPDGTFAGHDTREDPMHQQTIVLVQTAEGGRPAFPGDWIVTDHMGNASVMKDSDFYSRYVADAPAPVAPAPVAAKAAAPVVPAHAPVAAVKPAVPAPAPVAPTAVKPAVPTAAVKPAAPVSAKPVHDILT